MPHWVIKACAIGPGLVVSAVAVGLVVALLPPLVGLAALGASGLAAISLATGRAEAAATALLLGARRAQRADLDALAPAMTAPCRVRLGPPLIEVRVRRGSPVAAAGVGRRTVVVTSGLIDALADGALPPGQAAAVIGHAVAVVRSGLVRSDPLLAAWSAPWLLLARLVRGITRAGRRFPFVAAGWRLRGVVIAVAVAQALHAGHVGLGLGLVVVGACSYLLPVAGRRWQNELLTAGDRGLVAAGLGEHMAAYLRRCPQSATVRARIHALDPSPRQRPRIGLVAAPR
ncbi:MAG: hypothetical protein KQH57_11145 [Actinomycetales bacterium]|nr:hypothetical protein [Actinomycetales bacterium]